MHIMGHSLLKDYRIQQHQQEEIGLRCQRLSFNAAARACVRYCTLTDMTQYICVRRERKLDEESSFKKIACSCYLQFYRAKWCLIF